MVNRVNRNKPGKFDIFIEIIALAGLVCLIFSPLYYYKDLPELLPLHFGISGEADTYGNKVVIWSLPVTGLLLYVLLTVISRLPHLFNYPVKVRAANSEVLQRYARMAIKALKILIIYSFLYINYKTIIIGLGRASGLGVFYLPLFLSLLVLLIGIMIYKMKQVN